MMALAAVVLALLLTSHALCQQQVLSRPGKITSHKQVITPELSELVEALLRDGNVPGMTLGAVHPNGTIELGAFGRKAEDDDKMTVDVGSSCCPEHAPWNKLTMHRRPSSTLPRALRPSWQLLLAS